MRALLWSTPLLVMALAGCVGGADVNGSADVDADDTGARATATATASVTGTATGKPSASTTSTSPAGNGTGNTTAGNGTSPGNGTDDAAGNHTMDWSYDNRTGTLSGNEAVVLHASSKAEAFNVTNDTALVELNLSVEGDDVRLTVRPAGCATTSCERTVTTEDGQANLTFETPANGSWRATLAIAGGMGPVSSDYELSIGTAFEAPANATADGNATEPGNATHSGTSTSSSTVTSSASSSTSSTATTTGRQRR